jgi:hypothetical protein
MGNAVTMVKTIGGFNALFKNHPHIICGARIQDIPDGDIPKALRVERVGGRGGLCHVTSAGPFCCEILAFSGGIPRSLKGRRRGKWGGIYQCFCCKCLPVRGGGHCVGYNFIMYHTPVTFFRERGGEA